MFQYLQYQMFHLMIGPKQKLPLLRQQKQQ
jgi:hypothetical protein